MGYVILIIGIFILEFWIKNQVEKGDGGEKLILNNRVLLRRHYNKGAMFNFMEGKRKIVAFVSAIMTVFVFFLFLYEMGIKKRAWKKLGLSLLLGGGISNSYDRIVRKYVVDYFSFNVRWNWLRKMIFNLSDFSIFLGALFTSL